MFEKIKNRERRKLTKMQRNQERLAYLFILPALVFFTVFVLAPIVMALYFSLCDFSQRNITLIEWAGFKNYIEIFTAPGLKSFRESLWHVLYYAVMYVPMVVIMSLLFAVLINQKIRGVKAFRIMYYIPSITSGVAVSFIFQFLFSAADYGLMNTVIGWFGGQPMNWLGTEGLAMFCIALVNVWGGIGGNMIIYLAALQGVPPDQIEAARVDGANKRQIFLHITLPQIAQATFFVVMMSLIGSFQLYDQVKIMTGGGSGTNTPVFQIYMMAFDPGSSRSGMANAMAVVLFVVIMIVTSLNNFLQNRINKKYE